MLEMSDFDEWDAKSFLHVGSVPPARLLKILFILLLVLKTNRLESHRPGVELIFYLALIGYETKVLVRRLMEASGDRYVWENYLALHLHEVLERAPNQSAQSFKRCLVRE